MKCIVHTTQAERGYVAITTTLIFSVVILFIATSIGAQTLIARTTRLEYLNKRTSVLLARSCLDIALLQLAADENYAGGETRIIGGQPCNILAVTSAPPNRIITTTAVVSGATTNLKATVNAATLQHVALEELVVQ